MSLTAVEDLNVTGIPEDERANFSELSDYEQQLFLEAHNCSCNVEQRAFLFNDKDRLKYVNYNSTWYYLRVSIV